jgi:hypothetical protein
LIFDDSNRISNQASNKGGETKVKRRTILVVTVALLMVLSASSIIAISQAWWKPKPEYVGFDLKVIYGPVTITYVDASGAPELVIVEHIIETAVECTVAIDDKVYSYPDDFDISVTHHVELNALTGNGLVRTVGTFTFKLPGKPTLTYWGVARITGLWQTPEGTLINPQDFRGQGEFQLSGTKLFNRVEGFGLGDTVFNPPEYTNQYVHQIGFIKAWPL